MKLLSTNHETSPTPFSEAALQGLAPDGGLFMPESWPALSSDFLDDLTSKTLQDIGYKVSQLFIDDLSDSEVKEVIDDALNFDAPLVPLDGDTYVLELFHGPTLAFKDFGARFMSRFFSALKKNRDRDLIILAATSGDTGSAVAQGFLGVEGVKVCLLYPSGKVSKIQEQQLTTAGGNVTALEVQGTFDNCQQMVKKAFSNKKLNDKLLLSSANSINIARLLPQTFYYFYALGQLPGDRAPIFTVPSGNFGNLTAGLMAQKIGLSAKGFIAATNTNDTFPNYLDTGDFDPKASKQTISNAMDVGNPSNFARINAIFNASREQMQQKIWSASFTDDITRQAIRELYTDYDYLADPHTAVGYAATKKYRNDNPTYFENKSNAPSIILSTAHPAKFGDVIEPVIDKQVPIPERLQDCLGKTQKSTIIDNDYSSLEDFLLGNYH